MRVKLNRTDYAAVSEIEGTIWRLTIALFALFLTPSSALAADNCTDLHRQLTRENIQVKTRLALTDYLIVQLRDGHDDDNFQQLLKETHSTFVKTITAGAAKVQIIQVEPGRATTTIKKFTKSKDISCVEQNQLCYFSGTEGSVRDAGPIGKFNLREELALLARFESSRNKLFGLTGHAKPAPPAPPPITVDPVPNDPDFSTQWDLPAMNWSAARTSALPSPAPTYLYILDTGLAPVPNELGTTAVQLDFSAVPSPTGAQVPLGDLAGHGTMVASVSATTDNNFGLAGVANFEGAQTYVYMFLTTPNNQFGSTINYLEAMAGLLASNLPVGPVNLSFEYSPPNTVNADPMIQSFAQQLRNKGYLVVLAAGNYGMYDSSPELYCRRVAAIDASGNLTSWSNTGPFSAAAPGNAIPVYNPNSPGGVPITSSGTSFAAPRWCSAILAVMRYLPASQRTVLNADQIVFNSATVTPQGYRIPNFAAAIKMAIGVP